MGKYESALKEAMSDNTIEYSVNEDMAMTSAGVLDLISERHPELPLSYTMMILEDAKKILLQLIGI